MFLDGKPDFWTRPCRAGTRRPPCRRSARAGKISRSLQVQTQAETLMKRLAATAVLLLLSAAIVGGQTRGGWLRGTWEGKGYQSDSENTWDMRLTVRGRSYTV